MYTTSNGRKVKAPSQTPTASEPYPVHDAVYQFLQDVTQTKRLPYTAPHEEFIRNAVLEDLRGIIELCLRPQSEMPPY